jgi:site-specific DNA-methyltransferase (adenine-specific)
VVWYYTFGVNSAKKFTRSHCHVLHYVVNPKDFIFDATAVRVASARETVYGDARAAADGRLPDDTWIIRPAPGLFPEDADTWCASRICGTFAQRRAVPNQLPEQLIGRIVRTCSLPGDTVLDPMCGSGTVPTVAKKLGRSYIGVEQSKKFMAIAAQRVQQATVGAALT